jgi:glucokinase
MRGEWVIGLDLGGTKIAGGLVRLPEGRIVERRIVPTRRRRAPARVLEDAIAMARALARRAPRPPGGVGIGVPELVDPRGRVISGQSIDWRGIRVERRFKEFGRVRVEADVRASALAEARFGAGRNRRSFVYVTIGTGISSTLVVGGVPFAGARGNALVMASAPTTIPCARCGRLVSAVLERVASGPALARRFGGRSEEVLAAARRGHARAGRIVREAATALGSGLGFLVNVLDPEAVVVGGGLGTAKGPYWRALVASTRRHIWAPATRRLPIVQAKLGADAGVIGAAACAGSDAFDGSAPPPDA